MTQNNNKDNRGSRDLHAFRTNYQNTSSNDNIRGAVEGLGNRRQSATSLNSGQD